MDPLLMIVLGGAALLLVKPDILGPTGPPTPPPGSPLSLSGVGGAAAGIIIGIADTLAALSDRSIAELREDNVRAARGEFGRLFTMLQAPEFQDHYYALFASDHFRIYGDYWFRKNTARTWFMGVHPARLGPPAVNMILSDLGYASVSQERRSELLASVRIGGWWTNDLAPVINDWFRAHWMPAEKPEIIAPESPTQISPDQWVPTVDPGDIQGFKKVAL